MKFFKAVLVLSLISTFAFAAEKAAAPPPPPPMDKADAETEALYTPLETPAPAVKPAQAKTDIPAEAEIPAPEPVVQEQQERELEVETSGEVRTQYVTQQQDSGHSWYMTGLLGMGQYPSVGNVNGTYAVEAALGLYIDAFRAEIGFGMARYAMDVRNYVIPTRRDTYDVDSYQLNLAGKYQFWMDDLDGALKPVVGLQLSMVSREYLLTNGLTNNSNSTGSSQSMDGGLLLGLDYELSDSWALGGEVKLMSNLSNSVSSTYVNSTYGYIGDNLESLNYYVAGVSARMNF